MVIKAASGPGPLGLVPSIPKIFQRKILSLLLRLINGAALGDSGEWLENVDCTHLVPASGKLVLQKV